MRGELESPENLLLSPDKISLCRTSGWCWQNVLLAREAPNWSLSASRIPSSLLLTHRLAGYLQFLLSHHSIKLAEKGPPLLVLTKLGIEPVTLVSNIENSIKPGQTIVGIYLIHPELPLWSLGEFFPKNPNSILSYMSSRRTGIEDLKSDLICRLFAAPDIEEKGGGAVWEQICKCSKKLQIRPTANVKVHFWNKSTGGLVCCALVSRWRCGHERRISNARLNNDDDDDDDGDDGDAGDELCGHERRISNARLNYLLQLTLLWSNAF